MRGPIMILVGAVALAVPAWADVDPKVFDSHIQARDRFIQREASREAEVMRDQSHRNRLKVDRNISIGFGGSGITLKSTY